MCVISIQAPSLRRLRVRILQFEFRGARSFIEEGSSVACQEGASLHLESLWIGPRQRAGTLDCPLAGASMQTLAGTRVLRTYTVTYAGFREERLWLSSFISTSNIPIPWTSIVLRMLLWLFYGFCIRPRATKTATALPTMLLL